MRWAGFEQIRRMIGKTSFELTGKRVYVAGHGGMVGQALVRRLSRENCDIITAPRSVDLRDRNATFDWFGGKDRKSVV